MMVIRGLMGMIEVALTIEQILSKNSKNILSTSARYSCGTSFPFHQMTL